MMRGIIRGGDTLREGESREATAKVDALSALPRPFSPHAQAHNRKRLDDQGRSHAS